MKMTELFGWLVILCLSIFAMYGLWSLIDEYEENDHEN